MQSNTVVYMKLRPSLALSILSLLCIIGAASCTKTYICHCDIKYTGVPGLPDSTSKEFNITDTKSNASSTCSKQSQTYVNNYITSVENCYLY